MKSGEEGIHDPIGKYIPFARSRSQCRKVFSVMRTPNGGFKATKKIVSGLGSGQPGSKKTQVLFEWRGQRKDFARSK